MSLSEIRVRGIIVLGEAQCCGVYQNKEPCEAKPNIDTYFSKAHQVKLVAKGFAWHSCNHHSCMAVW
jgi:hypothetical protein